MIYVGIDPGLNGAIAAVSSSGKFIAVDSTPTVVVKKGKHSRTKYLPTAMAEILRDLKERYPDLTVALEFVRARPGQGVTSMFSMGIGVGLWCGILAGLEIPMTEVTPQSWKKAIIGVKTGDDKNASIVTACRIFPKASAHLTRVKDDGRAEALLIAEYLRRVSAGRVST